MARRIGGVAFDDVLLFHITDQYLRILSNTSWAASCFPVFILNRRSTLRGSFRLRTAVSGHVAFEAKGNGHGIDQHAMHHHDKVLIQPYVSSKQSWHPLKVGLFIGQRADSSPSAVLSRPPAFNFTFAAARIACFFQFCPASKQHCCKAPVFPAVLKRNTRLKSLIKHFAFDAR